jgi:hypothetical protein
MAGPAQANGAAAKTADAPPAAVDVMAKARSDDPGLAVDDVGREPRLDAIYRKVRRSGGGAALGAGLGWVCEVLVGAGAWQWCGL